MRLVPVQPQELRIRHVVDEFELYRVDRRMADEIMTMHWQDMEAELGRAVVSAAGVRRQLRRVDVPGYQLDLTVYCWLAEDADRFQHMIDQHFGHWLTRWARHVGDACFRLACWLEARLK